jgi:peptide methionine sulfoxide reductase MsrA
VKYNPAEVTFKGLLDVFFGRVDVTALNRQVLNPIYIKIHTFF